MRRAITYILGSLFGILPFAPTTGVACDYCGIYTVLPAHELTARSVQLGVTESLIGYGKMRKDGKATTDARGQNLKTTLTEIDVEYDLTSRVGFLAALPFPYQSYTREEGDGLVSGSNGGFGDLALYAFANPVQYYRGGAEFVWEFFAGAKLPTGDTSKLKEEDAEQRTKNISDSTSHERNYNGIRAYSKWGNSA